MKYSEEILQSPQVQRAVAAAKFLAGKGPGRYDMSDVIRM